MFVSCISKDGCQTPRDGFSSSAYALSVHTDVQSAAHGARIPVDNLANTRTSRQNTARTQNLLDTLEIQIPSHPDQWRRVDIDGIDVLMSENQIFASGT